MKKQEIEMLAKRLRGRERTYISNALSGWISLSERFRNAWFWIPPKHAWARRRYERENSMCAQGKRYSIEFSVKCSCRNIYIKKDIVIHGYKLNLADARKLVAILSERRQK